MADTFDLVHSRIVQSREDHFWTSFASTLSGLPPMTGRVIRGAVNFHTSSWLNVLLLVHHHMHFDCQHSSFRDALCLCYHNPLSLMPTGCGVL